MNDMRVCVKCAKSKPSAAYHRDSTRSDGVHPYCKSCRKGYSDEYYVSNFDAITRRNKAWKKGNDEYRERQRAYGKGVYGGRKGYQREWTRLNREKANAYSREWRRRDPEHAKEVSRRGRAARVARLHDQTPTFISADDLAARLSMSGGCWICGEQLVDFHIDHVKPIIVGGLHCLSNLRPACPACNMRKHSQWPVDTSTKAVRLDPARLP